MSGRVGKCVNGNGDLDTIAVSVVSLRSVVFPREHRFAAFVVGKTFSNATKSCNQTTRGDRHHFASGRSTSRITWHRDHGRADVSRATRAGPSSSLSREHGRIRATAFSKSEKKRKNDRKSSICGTGSRARTVKNDAALEYVRQTPFQPRGPISVGRNACGKHSWRGETRAKAPPPWQRL